MVNKLGGRQRRTGSFRCLDVEKNGSDGHIAEWLVVQSENHR